MERSCLFANGLLETELGKQDLCDTCSSAGEHNDAPDDDAISLCSWTTDQGDWEPVRSHSSRYNIDCGVTTTDAAFDDGDGTHVRDQQYSMRSNDCVQSTSSYLPMLVPLSTVWHLQRQLSDSLLAESKAANVDIDQSSDTSSSRKSTSSQRQRQRGSRGKGKHKTVMDRQDSRLVDLANLAATDHESRTTIILRNFPLEWSRDELIERLNDEGLRGCFDFVHLPFDFQTKASLRYAVVNLTSHALAVKTLEYFQVTKLWTVAGDEPFEAAWNEPHQGLDAHVERYKNSPLMHPTVLEVYRPVLYHCGTRIQFPEPTARIRPPRIRHQKVSASPAA